MRRPEGEDAVPLEARASRRPRTTWRPWQSRTRVDYWSSSAWHGGRPCRRRRIVCASWTARAPPGIHRNWICLRPEPDVCSDSDPTESSQLPPRTQHTVVCILTTAVWRAPWGSSSQRRGPMRAARRAYRGLHSTHACLSRGLRPAARCASPACVLRGPPPPCNRRSQAGCCSSWMEVDADAH